MSRLKKTKLSIKTRENDLDSLLTPEQSEERIIILLIVLTFIFSFFLLLLFFWVFFTASFIKSTIYIEPDIKRRIGLGFPIPHFAIVTESGKILTFISPLLHQNLERTISLKQIPKFRSFSENHLTGQSFWKWETDILLFSTDTKIFFLFGDSARPMIQFDTIEDRHREISRGRIRKHQEREAKGALMGKYFVVMGGFRAFDGQGSGINENRRTDLWSISKQKWFDGPQFPDSAKYFGMSEHYTTYGPQFTYICLTPINDSVLFIIGHDRDEPFAGSYNFRSKVWTIHSTIPHSKKDPSKIDIVDCATFITKQYKRNIVALSKATSSVFPTFLMIYDIDSDLWKTKHYNVARGLLSISGSIFLIDYQTSDEIATEIKFIPFDTDFQWATPIKRQTNITHKDPETLTKYSLFSKPVCFQLRRFKE